MALGMDSETYAKLRADIRADLREEIMAEVRQQLIPMAIARSLAMSLSGKIALVTGASRGIGRGIALQLGEAGATVYITGREPKHALDAERGDLPTLEATANEITKRGGKGIAIYVDHSDMGQVEKLFARLKTETDGQLDILVNNAYSAVQALCDVNGKTFWEMDASIWDEVNNVGLRNHYYCCVYAARMMVPRKRGLIVNISSVGGLTYLFNVAYGVGKCAVDRMAADMANELRTENVAIVSLWPGAVRTELFKKVVDSGKYDNSSDPQVRKMRKFLEEGESTEFAGKAVVTLAKDTNIMKKSGRVLIAADLGLDYKFTDIDGRQPPSLRSAKALLDIGGYSKIGDYLPNWLRIPGWLMTALTRRQPPSLRSAKALLDIGGYSKIGDYLPNWLRIPGWLMTALTSRL
ncbi:Dehydrogenase/reductase SDR family member 1 [Toxocara canis]|uniref:Dehydrogenase/reductase SDR family member 1 n=1 Tax=Toxocara canis TaxID=6265 RepID=A0A0B2VSK7_TOXCA|nr:Dehydrogenase/reductase SDR family member 1 [Toxocara canis]